MSADFSFRIRLLLCLSLCLYPVMSLSADNSDRMKVDFSYAFAVPHRITACLPNSSDKTLLDAYPTHLRMGWTYGNLLDKPLSSFTTPRTEWEVLIKMQRDGNNLENGLWQRMEGWLPVLEYTCHDDVVTVRLQIVGGQTAAIVKINVINHDNQSHQVAVRCERPGGLTGYNPAWVQSDWDADVLLAGWKDRADRIIVFALGGDQKPVVGANTISQVWQVPAGQIRNGFIIRPYRANHSMLPALKGIDWSQQFNNAVAEWKNLINRAARFTIPDSAVQNAFYAGLADCYVMREPVSQEYIAGTPGTEGYRAPGSGEPAIVAVLLDQLGLHADAVLGYQMCIDQQGPDGNWADPLGWGHYWWGASGFKSWPIMEHYRLTGDSAYLASVYPRMLASSRWQEQQRRKTRVTVNGEQPLTFGLMPRGMGDCGLKDGDDLYGVFFPHNMWAVFADAMTLDAAQILRRTGDIPELQKIHGQALSELLQALQRGSISENGYRWIPGVPGKTCGSRWGVLNAAFPLHILEPHHELIDGTVRKIEAQISPGGIPLNTGWLKDGMWVAITLDNLAEVLLLRDEGDAASRYLYATLNHGTPLYSWCEERGPEPGSKQITGDRQHLWTPLAVSRFIRDALVMEDGNTLHLARGSARQWLLGDAPLAVKDAETYWGKVSYELQYNVKKGRLTGYVELAGTGQPSVALHVRLPLGRKIQPLTVPKEATLDVDHETIRWPKFRKYARIDLKCE
jgi:hypothetical protein